MQLIFIFIFISLLACTPDPVTDGPADDSITPEDTPTTDSGSGEDSEAPATDADGDGFDATLDCDDDDASVYPGAAELCNNKSDDCDDVVDEGWPTSTWYLDSDGDGYGAPDTAATSCAAPEGYVASGADCDDADAAVFDCAASCLGWLEIGDTTSGERSIDPDGPGGVAPYLAWCDQETEDGGWTLVLDRTHEDECCVYPCSDEAGVPTTLSAAEITRDTLNTGMDGTRFGALLAISTEALALGAQTMVECADTTVELVTTISSLQSGDCVTMGTDLSALPLAWDELSDDCGAVGSDYSIWFGTTSTYMTGVCDYASHFGVGWSCWHPGTMEMYVR